jgi:hypothetical protein
MGIEIEKGTSFLLWGRRGSLRSKGGSNLGDRKRNLFCCLLKIDLVGFDLALFDGVLQHYAMPDHGENVRPK